MLKNKIYNYISFEILKNFITILLTFTAIAWTVRAVNFLDLMIEDGYSAQIYFKYSVFSVSTIMTRFVPLSFLIALIISIIKFERQQELLILWVSGLNKIKIINIIFLVSFFITLLQIILGLFINPLALNKSRSLLRNTEIVQIDSIIRSNDFSDSFKGLTFYIEDKNVNGELLNVFIKDTSGTLNTIMSEVGDSNNSTVIAKKGFLKDNKLILFDGVVQTLNKKKEIKNVSFKKTELSIKNFSTRTIKHPKIQETSSSELMKCLVNKNYDENLQNCPFNRDKKEIIQNVLRRIGTPLYIPLVAAISSFMLFYKKEKKYNYLKKYIIFSLSFIFLLFAEILLKFTGITLINTYLYLFSPVILFLILYFILIKKTIYNKIL